MNEIPKRYLSMSRTVAGRVPKVLDARGLEPIISDWILTSYHGRVWLFGVLAVSKASRLERYADPALLHHLSTALRGLPVYTSNSSGFRYGFLLTRPPQLPRKVELPESIPAGTVMLGVDAGGAPVTTRWTDLGHILVAGMTRSGKSTFLRLLAWQALREQAQLLLADVDGVTFPMLAGHPGLLAPVALTAEDMADVVGRALGECERRAELYSRAPGYPETLDEYNQVAGEPLPRVLVILDEFNSAVTTLGGPRSSFAAEAARLAWRGLKFGVNLVFAAQDFSKAALGAVRDQVRAAICFRVRSPATARAVGCAGAESIPAATPGRALTDRWGPLQAYYLDKARLIDGVPRSPLDDQELALVAWALEQNDGYLPTSSIEERGWGHREARRLVRAWENRGWLEKDAEASNCRRITPALSAII